MNYPLQAYKDAHLRLESFMYDVWDIMDDCNIPYKTHNYLRVAIELAASLSKQCVECFQELKEKGLSYNKYNWVVSDMVKKKFNYEPRLCFENAQDYVLNDSHFRYVYCEGIAKIHVDNANRIIHHAWAIDTKTGKVIDPTWGHNNGLVYFGIRHERNMVVEFVNNHKLGASIFCVSAFIAPDEDLCNK